MDDALVRDFYAYGMGAGIPPSAGHFLAEFCDRHGDILGAHLLDPIRLARLIGLRDFRSGETKTENVAAIIAFLREHGFATAETDGSLRLTDHGVTWWEQFNRPATAGELRGLLFAAGLGRIADMIERQALPSIRLTAHPVEDEDALPVGTSKLGGSPDLPSGFTWPMQKGYPLAFIAQINLADVFLHNVERLLPQQGLLHFFYGQFNAYSLGPDRSSANHVAYFDADFGALARTAMRLPLPNKDCGPYRCCAVSFTEEITLPDYLPYYEASWHSGIRERLGPIDAFTVDEREAYSAVQRRLQGPAYNINRMLGHPDPIQGIDLPPEEVLLLQVDSEDEFAGMMWGDVGRLYWWMQKDDLARRDFGNIQFDEQCC